MHKTLSAALFCAGILVVPAQAQDAAPGKIHGHVTNAIGAPVSSGEVRLTTDRSSEADKRKFAYTFKVDASGDYVGEGVKPDNYLLMYYDQGKMVDYIDNVKITSGQDVLQNDDMTREEFQKTLTPEQKKQYEEIKQKNASALASNAKIGNVNALLKKARDERQAKQYDQALTDMQQAVQIKPDEGLLWNELGNAQYDNKKYDDAITSYQKALDLNAASKKPSADITAVSYAQMGLALALTGKIDDGVAAMDKAAQADPAKAGTYYYNAAAVLYNAQKTDAAAAAADKAITADPKRAEAYYIKGQSLIGKSTVDSKSQKIVPPDGCVEAYEKYLELDPNGRHAADVKGILASFDEKVVNSYRAGKKK